MIREVYNKIIVPLAVIKIFLTVVGRMSGWLWAFLTLSRF